MTENQTNKTDSIIICAPNIFEFKGGIQTNALNIIKAISQLTDKQIDVILKLDQRKNPLI